MDRFSYFYPKLFVMMFFIVYMTLEFNASEKKTDHRNIINLVQRKSVSYSEENQLPLDLGSQSEKDQKFVEVPHIPKHSTAEIIQVPSSDAELQQIRVDLHDSATGIDVPTSTNSQTTSKDESIPVPFPEGLAKHEVYNSTGSGKIPPECLTIVQISNHIDWDGLDAEHLVEIAAKNPNRISYILGLVQMYLYAKRHGHGYRVVSMEGKSIKMGSGRPDRHPAWSRVPLLWLLYNGGVGADLVLDKSLSGKKCNSEDRWVLYLDTDVVVLATGWNIGTIIESLRAHEMIQPGIPCQNVYSDPKFAEAAKKAGPNASFCHLYHSQLKTPLARGVDPATDIAVAGFNDLYFKAQDCKSMLNPESGKCPDPVQNNMCSAIMLWRLPAPQLANKAKTSPTVSRAIDAGKAMVDIWRKSRLAPGGDDREDFLAMNWFQVSQQRIQTVFKEGVDETRCSTTSCGFAGDQTVFNRAVLYGLPHRPWNATDVDNKGIGRFIKHTAIFKCEHCVKDGTYLAGEPFFHGTAWKFKRDHLIAWMLKLSYELHGLHYIFPYTQITTANKNATPVNPSMLSNKVPLLQHPDNGYQTQLNNRLKNICHAEDEASRRGCVHPEDEKRSNSLLNSAIRAIKNDCQLQMRHNPAFEGIDSVDTTVDWYQVFQQ